MRVRIFVVELVAVARLGHVLTVPLLTVLLYLALAARAAALSCPVAASLTPGPPATYQPATQ